VCDALPATVEIALTTPVPRGTETGADPDGAATPATEDGTVTPRALDSPTTELGAEPDGAAPEGPTTPETADEATPDGAAPDGAAPDGPTTPETADEATPDGTAPDGPTTPEATDDAPGPYPVGRDPVGAAMPDPVMDAVELISIPRADDAEEADAMLSEKEDMAEDKCLLVIAALADSAAVTGQTVVAKVMVSVTITALTPSAALVVRAGQSVTVGAQLITVRTVVAKTVKVVWGSVAAVVLLLN
jgi:hypothetical protein